MKCQKCGFKFVVELEDKKTITIGKETDSQLRELILRTKKGEGRIKTYDDIILDLIKTYKEKYKDRLNVSL